MKKLSWKELFFLVILGIPGFGMAFSYVFITMYLPYFIEKLSNAAITGILIGGESIFAISVPSLMGAWSDRIQTFIGRRMPFIFSGALLIALALLLMPFSTNSLLLLGIELAIYYIGYFTFYTGYYAIFADYIPHDERGRSLGVQGSFRSLGMLLALASGGFMIDFWKPLGFLIGAFIILAVSLVIYFGIRSKIKQVKDFEKSETSQWLAEWELLHNNKKILLWFIANSCWESSISALKVFVVIYFTQGIHFTLTHTSAALTLVGISAIIAAPISGKLADKYSHRPVILCSIIFFSLGLLPPILTFNSYFVVAILPVAFSAVVLMTLPYSLLIGFLPRDKFHGVGAAIYGFSQGIGALVGPLLAGLAIEATKNFHFLVFAETKGYVAVFPVSSMLLMLSIPFVIKLFYLK